MSLANNMFLSHWSDILGDSSSKEYVDYDALIQSDDEFLVLCSLDHDAEEFENEF